MTGRPWILTLAVGLGACSQPGCLAVRTASDTEDAAEVVAAPRYFKPQGAPAPTAAIATAMAQSNTADAAPSAASATLLRQPPQPAPAEAIVPPLPPMRSAALDRPPEIRIVAAGVDKSETPLISALRGLQDKRPTEEVLAALNTYEPAERELLRDVLQMAVRLSDRDASRTAPLEVAATLDDMDALLRALRPRAALVLDKLCFCRSRSVDNFGVYEPLQDGHAFRAASPGHPGERVQVYAEVRNFASRPAGDQFETVLKGQLTIVGHTQPDGGPEKVITFNLEPCTDRSRTPRQDFFVNFHFDTPRLPPGSYTLWVQVEDVTPAAEGGKRPARLARRSLDFKVGSAE